MKKVMLTRFGFVREGMEDYTDGGIKYTYYRYNGIKVSKSFDSEGKIYIFPYAALDNRLTYDIFNTLPHFNAIMALDGVSLDNLGDNDLEQLCKDLDAYKAEYEDCRDHLSYPTLEEMCEKEKATKAAYYKVYLELKERFVENMDILITCMSGYEKSNFMNYLEYFASMGSGKVPEDKYKEILNTAYSIRFMERDDDPYKDYKYLNARALLDTYKAEITIQKAQGV